ncbi:MAG: tetratricopeptide repeat protein [Phycisphaerales bacterium]|nr:MAG: tetratricopeptide repeat protein [Phycisphaerales bacterium]
MKATANKRTAPALLLLILSWPGVLKADLVAYWDFDDANGTTVTDKYGGCDGNFAGDPEWVEGHSGGAIGLDGSGDYVDCRHDEVFDINDRITVSAWIKVERFNREWQTIIAKGDSAWRLTRAGGADTIAFHLTGLTLHNEQVYGVTGLIGVEDGQWHHLAGVYDGSVVSLYVDGVLDAEQSASGNIGTNDFSVLIGENAEMAGRWFCGSIDDVAIFDQPLSAEQVERLYNRGIGSYVSPSVLRLISAFEKAQALAGRQKLQEAIALVEGKIAEHELWAKENAGDVEIRHGLLCSRLYAILADAKQRAGRPAREVAEAYKKCVSSSLRGPCCVAALTWLCGRIPAADCVSCVRAGAKDSGKAAEYMSGAAGDFESGGNWEAFELFLGGVLGAVEDVNACASAVAQGLEQSEQWTAKFRQYCRGKRELRAYYVDSGEKLAQAEMEQNEPMKASEIYRDIAKLIEDGAGRMAYEIKALDCVFRSGQSTRAISELDDFIGRHKGACGGEITKAYLLKGRAYLQTGQTDKANDVFSSLMAECPDTGKTAAPHFYIGYCNMLRGRAAGARASFERVVGEHPESDYAVKAKLCLGRMEKMGKK